MDAIKMIKDRRSVRKFTEEKVDRNIIKEIIDIARYAPTWSNSQTARYTVVDDKATLEKIANEGIGGFEFNKKTTGRAAGAIVVSAVKGFSGYSPEGKPVTVKNDDSWEMFDAGVSCQTLCLTAHEKGIGTVIMGIFDEKKVAEIVNLPENEVVTAIIPYGYPLVNKGAAGAPARKGVDEILRFI